MRMNTPKSAVVLGLALIISTIIISNTAYKIKSSGETIEVTGSAKVAVVSDLAKWTINLETKTGNTNQPEGYARLDDATKQITEYLKEKGYTDIETPAPSIYPTYVYPQNGEPYQTGYQVSRQIIVRSDDVKGIEELAGANLPQKNQSYTISTGSVELTYQKLPETRVALLSDAIKDATARAEAIAKESGRSVNQLKSATGGVVQVLPVGGVEVADYGSYDTSSINKEVMVTVRATFTLK
jgi:uncharacterized protein